MSINAYLHYIRFCITLEKMISNGAFQALFLFACLIKTSICCDGYEINAKGTRNCAGNNVIEVNNFDITLDKNCHIIATGCVTVTRPFQTFEFNYTASKSSRSSVSGNFNMCELLKEQNNLSAMLESLGFPGQCPSGAVKNCSHGDKYDITMYRKDLQKLAGNYRIKLEARHDSGNTCIEFNLRLHRKKSAYFTMNLM